MIRAAPRRGGRRCGTRSVTSATPVRSTARPNVTENKQNRRAASASSPREKTTQLQPKALEARWLCRWTPAGLLQSTASSSLGHLKAEICPGLVKGWIGFEKWKYQEGILVKLKGHFEGGYRFIGCCSDNRIITFHTPLSGHWMAKLSFPPKIHFTVIGGLWKSKSWIKRNASIYKPPLSFPQGCSSPRHQMPAQNPRIPAGATHSLRYLPGIGSSISPCRPWYLHKNLS